MKKRLWKRRHIPAGLNAYGSTSPLGVKNREESGGEIGFPVCGQSERHPVSGLMWTDMPGISDLDRKIHFFFHRRGLSVDEIVGGEIFRRFPDGRVDAMKNAGTIWHREYRRGLN